MVRPTKATLCRREALRTINDQRRLDAISKAESNTKNKKRQRKVKPKLVSTFVQCEPPSNSDASIQCQTLVADSSIQVRQLTRRKITPPEKTKNNEDGRVIISLNSLDDLVHAISFHASVCPNGPVTRTRNRKNGVNTTTTFQCGCGKSFHVNSDGPKDELKINDALVWGCTQSAIGFTAAKSLLLVMNLPAPSYGTFKKAQDLFFPQLTTAMDQNTKYWAEKEAELAKLAGETIIIDGKEYAMITVILDGGYSKRSYNHSFSSNCGVAVIIGAKTRKVLYVGTKVRTCFICDKQTSNQRNHTCYKNFNGPATAMESAIILEGFEKSMQDYGLIYWKFIGDGDSSVHAKVENVYPNLKVEKIECSNHVVRNFTTRLMDIATNRIRGRDAQKISYEERQIFNPKLQRFRTALVQAISHHHNVKSQWKDLYDDIMNMRYHIFGDHAKCKSYFCAGAKDNEINLVPKIMKLPIWTAIGNALQRPAVLSPSLVQKQTSNAAESFMSVACRFMEGKRKNFGQRYLYNLRISAAVLSYNESAYWAEKAMEYLYNRSGGPAWKRQADTAKAQKLRIKKFNVRKPLKVPQLAPACLHYNSDDPQRPDLPNDVLELKISELRSSLQVTEEEAAQIELATHDQANSSEWTIQRKNRITASRAGSIWKLRDTTNNRSTLNEFFNRKPVGALQQKAMEFGRSHEDTAIKKYEEMMNFSIGTVKKAGLVIYTKNGILGASPDGYIGMDGILEVKCPYTLYLKKMSPASWPLVSRSSSLKIGPDGELHLKKTHNHYFQVIMQLYVTRRVYCDYVVWSESGIFRERITRSIETDKLWEKMEAKFDAFWVNEIAPEIVDSRFSRGYTDYRLAGRQPVKSRKRKLQV